MAPTLRFRADGCFTIVQLTDLHWQNSDERDQQTRRLMIDVLEAEQPDLVIFTGDLIESLSCNDPLRSLREVAAVVEAQQIPFTAVLGNHDSEKGSREVLGAALSDFTYSLFEPGPTEISGVGNWVLPVLAHSSERPAAHLYGLDSGAYAPCILLGTYDWIKRDQIRWYIRQSRALRTAHGPLPALAFCHIPLPEYKRLWRTKPVHGHRFEKVNSPLWNSGLFAAMRQMGDVVGLFCGHDHLNDFWGELNGIRLYYGRATGYNTYGRAGFPRGARLIRLREGSRRIETWLRLDDGRRSPR